MRKVNKGGIRRRPSCRLPNTRTNSLKPAPRRSITRACRIRPLYFPCYALRAGRHANLESTFPVHPSRSRKPATPSCLRPRPFFDQNILGGKCFAPRPSARPKSCARKPAWREHAVGASRCRSPASSLRPRHRDGRVPSILTRGRRPSGQEARPVVAARPDPLQRRLPWLGAQWPRRDRILEARETKSWRPSNEFSAAPALQEPPPDYFRRRPRSTTSPRLRIANRQRQGFFGPRFFSPISPIDRRPNEAGSRALARAGVKSLAHPQGRGRRGAVRETPAIHRETPFSGRPRNLARLPVCRPRSGDRVRMTGRSNAAVQSKRLGAEEVTMLPPRPREPQ